MNTPIGRVSRRLLAVTALAVFVLGATSSCGYLTWRRQKSALRRELKERPWDLALRKEYAPQDCFKLTGRLSIPADVDTAFLLAAFDHATDGRDLVGDHEIGPHSGYYGVLLPSGSYDVLLFADLNHNGWYEADEVVARTPRDTPVLVDASQSSDGVLVPGPILTVDVQRPQTAPAAVRIPVDLKPYEVASV